MEANNNKKRINHNITPFSRIIFRWRRADNTTGTSDLLNRWLIVTERRFGRRRRRTSGLVMRV